jgi:hypothetical protein
MSASPIAGQLNAWLGTPAHEYSSGERRQFGHISRQGKG